MRDYSTLRFLGLANVNDEKIAFKISLFFLKSLKILFENQDKSMFSNMTFICKKLSQMMS